MQKVTILSSFWLKLIAIFTMTLDHLGLLLSFYYLNDGDYLVITFRSLGRLALPLYCFMICEGVLHTHNFLRYVSRLGVMVVIISVSLFVIGETDIFSSSMIKDAGNIFLDLTLGAVGIYCLSHKTWWIKPLALLPFGYGIASTLVTSHVYTKGGQVYWLPYFLRTQYGWFSIALIYGFYLGYLITTSCLKYHAKQIGVEPTLFKNTSIERKTNNIIDAFILLGLGALFIISLREIPFNIINQQVFCILSGALILFYSGKRGYNRKWFEYGCYLYYPVHIVLLGVIFYLINLNL